MKRDHVFAALLALHTASGLAAAEAAHAGSRKLTIYALTDDQRLLSFRENRPGQPTGAEITGLSGDRRLVGIDFRPANGALYAVGDAGGIYTLEPATGAATFRNALTLNGAPLALVGDSFGVDFNPTVDRLRIVSDAGQNLRVNVDTGAATEDGVLNVGGVPSLGVGGAAYTNNDADPNTATTLFDIDALLDQVAIQAPPNGGALNPTGKLGLDVAPELGFDIYTRVEDGGAVAARGFAALTTDRSRLYGVNLLTGAASLVGAFRERDTVIGLAIPPNQE